MLLKKLKDYKLILASQSPRRQELMKGLDVAFTVAPFYYVDETFPATVPKDEVPAFLALRKSERYPYPLSEQDILITADTMVWCKNEFLGKPKDEDDARRMLRLLSGCTHEVITGMCLRNTRKTSLVSTLTRVRFRQLDEEEISYYLSTYQPYDKAGAYGIQEWIGYAAIESIEGSYYNVMGLPIQRLYRALANLIEG
jgi:septum formation protein